jgi:hypothetical protein
LEGSAIGEPLTIIRDCGWMAMEGNWWARYGLKSQQG